MRMSTKLTTFVHVMFFLMHMFIPFLSGFRVNTVRGNRATLLMEVKNDPFARANREMRKAGADDRFYSKHLKLLFCSSFSST